MTTESNSAVDGRLWHDRFSAIVPSGSSTVSKASQLPPDEPDVIVRGDGCRVWDDRGREFIDYRNSLGPVTLGYRFSTVDDAIREQLASGIAFGHPHPLECEVAEMLRRMVPYLQRVRFLKTGGEAVAAAIRVARAFTDRELIVQIGYNGWLNSVATGAQVRPGIAAGRPAGVPAAVSALHHQVAWGNRAELERIFAEVGDRVAAIVVAADYRNLPGGASFYPYLRDLTRRAGALLVFDEVVTGFRVAIGGVAEYFGVAPDLAVFAKGIANGMPLSVFGGRADVMDQLTSQRVTVSSTLAGETLSLAAARATLRTYAERDVVGHLWKIGELLWSGVRDLLARHEVPLSVQGLPPCPALIADPDHPEAFATLLRLAYRHGVSLYATSYVTFSHHQRDIDETLERLDAACGEFAEYA